MLDTKDNLEFCPFSDYDERFFDVFLNDILVGEIKYNKEECKCYFKASCLGTYFDEIALLTILYRVSELNELCNRKRSHTRKYT